MRCRISIRAARNGDRKKYRAAIEKATFLGAKQIPYYMNDRECRNWTDHESTEKLARSGAISVHYVKDGKVLDESTSYNDFLMRDVVALTNVHFIRNLKTKVVDAMKAKAESGWMPANHVPLGYVHQKMRDGNGKELKRETKLARNPDESVILQVQREFELRAQGFSYEAIRAKIGKEGCWRDFLRVR